ncbi:hypothetical protein Nepgr_030066 [Nepenthes gracilis]|uniref:Uncharacterized protein n=1 Tax=Nepenthes gracilis TaxID=150966 RepID=A0AAD3TFP8_NEPGR|nr:hypothetical protein Nepgr_030066 [Nepenthes gracilis]
MPIRLILPLAGPCSVFERDGFLQMRDSASLRAHGDPQDGWLLWCLRWNTGAAALLTPDSGVQKKHSGNPGTLDSGVQIHSGIKAKEGKLQKPKHSGFRSTKKNSGLKAKMR